MFGYNMIYMNDGVRFSSKIARVIFHRNKLLLICFLMPSMVIMRRNPYYLAMLLMSMISVCLSGRNYGHYQMYLMPFMIPFAYEAATRVPKARYKYVMPALLAVTLMLGFRPPEFIRAMFGRKVFYADEYVPHNEKYYSESERVLVTGNYVRIYILLGVIPQEKYFYTPATDYKIFPEPVDAQVSSILRGENDVIVITYTNPEHEVYPESGRSAEINQLLATQYDLLYYDEHNNTAMYGRKN